MLTPTPAHRSQKWPQYRALAMTYATLPHMRTREPPRGKSHRAQKRNSPAWKISIQCGLWQVDGQKKPLNQPMNSPETRSSPNNIKRVLKNPLCSNLMFPMHQLIFPYKYFLQHMCSRHPCKAKHWAEKLEGEVFFSLDHSDETEELLTLVKRWWNGSIRMFHNLTRVTKPASGDLIVLRSLGPGVHALSTPQWTSLVQWGHIQGCLCLCFPSKNGTHPSEKYHSSPRTQSRLQVGLTATIPSDPFAETARQLHSFRKDPLWCWCGDLASWLPSFDYYYFTTNFPVKSFICAKAHPALSTFLLVFEFYLSF